MVAATEYGRCCLIYQRPHRQSKQPAKRLQTGVAGSPLTVIAPKPPSQRVVLLHFCFDQRNGETKKESCPCKQRVPFDEATDFVQQGCADWLLIKNPKSVELVKFRRAVVVGRVVVDGEILFAVHNSEVKINRRDLKHEQIKADVRAKARRVLENLFSKGLVPHFVVRMNNAQLDSLLSDAKECRDFLTTLSAAPKKKWIKVMKHWWNNVLGYFELGVDEGRFMTSADQGTGEIVFSGEGWQTDAINGAHENDTGHVTGANFRPHFWNGGWLFTLGAGSDKYEDDSKNDSEVNFDGIQYDDNGEPAELAAPGAE